MTTQKQVATPMVATEYEILVVGAGFSGIGMSVKLLENGITNFTVLERSNDIGGTWRDNTYPGAECDIPSILYSYSFEQNPQWTQSHSSSSEILQYMKDVVMKHQISPYIQLNTNVESLTFDEKDNLWMIQTNKGIYKARSVLMASGALTAPKMPAIKGIDTFKGEVIHSAQWHDKINLADKRVAVIGTGASAVQIIPSIVDKVKTLKVFQRTPAWVLPKFEYKTSQWQKTLFKNQPRAQALARSLLYYVHESMALGFVWDTPLTRVFEKMSRSYLHSQVQDRWLRRQLTPDYHMGCKRVLMTSEYYKAIQKANCELITWPIAEIRADGILASEGVLHEVDTIIFATGFNVFHSGTPFPITGLNGRKLNEEWANGAYAFKSVNVEGYPNLFFTLGPNSGPGHNSILVYIEAQLRYTLESVKMLRNKGFKRMNVKADVQHQYNVQIQQRLNKTTWNSGCSSWYLTKDGFNATMYPGFAKQYEKQLETIDPKHYVFN